MRMQCQCWNRPCSCFELMWGIIKSQFCLTKTCTQPTQAQPTKLSIVYFISSRTKPIIGSTEFLSIFFSNSKIPHNWFWLKSDVSRWNRHSQTNVTTHLLLSLEGQSTDREEQVETALYFLCLREKYMLHFDTEWAYKRLVINIVVAVHKMDFEAMK